MSKRVQVTLHEEDYELLQRIARGRGTTAAGWARQVIRDALEADTKKVEAKLRAVERAYSHRHPSGDIEDILRQIEEGRNLV